MTSVSLTIVVDLEHAIRAKAAVDSGHADNVSDFFRKCVDATPQITTKLDSADPSHL